jgi:hypothetical protein
MSRRPGVFRADFQHEPDDGQQEFDAAVGRPLHIVFPVKNARFSSRLDQFEQKPAPAGPRETARSQRIKARARAMMRR